MTCNRKRLRRDERQAQQVGGGGGDGGRGECQALDGYARSKRFDAGGLIDLLVFFNNIQTDVISYLQNCIDELRACKYFMCIHVHMFRVSNDSEIVRVDPHLRCNTQIGLLGSDFENDLITCFRDLFHYLELFNAEGSGWVIESIDYLDVFVGKYNPLAVAGSGAHSNLPDKLVAKRAVLNICSDDSRCFQYAVLASLYPQKKNATRASLYTPYIERLDWTGISYPTSLHQISTFEKRNNLAINVFGWEDDTTFPLRLSSNNTVNDKLVNLLLIMLDDEMHFCCIRSMSRLTHSRSKRGHKNFVCHFCLHAYTSQSRLDEHFIHCKRQQPQVTYLPDRENSIVKFKNYKNSIPVPFVIYIDLESLLVPIDCGEPINDPHVSATRKRQSHETCGWSMYVVCTHPELYDFKPIVYRGVDAMSKLLSELKRAECEIIKILENIIPATLSPAEWTAHYNATRCHICNELLDDSRCLDHDHLTGEYRGAAHKSCNLSYKWSKSNYKEKNTFRIPIFCHNLASYDAHLIMQSIGKNSRDQLSCLAFNFEKYLTFTCGNLQFVDTMYFLNKSLSGLVDDLKADGVHNFGHVRKVFPNDELFDLVLQKLPFCYDYFDSHEKFAETTLPSRDAFHNKLTGLALSEDDYVLVQTVWEKFNLHTLGDFHNLYVLIDTLLLASVFEAHRKLCLLTWGLDPAAYISTPQMAYDCMLRFTGVEINLLQDIDQYLFFESGIRGGLSYVGKRYAKANNPMCSDYNPEIDNSWIVYLDATNLYGNALCQYLPQGEFQWLSDREIIDFDVTSIADDADYGYMIECDLSYPNYLHDSHNAYPLAPGSLKIEDSMLSDYSRELKNELNMKGKSQTKLCSDLGPKKNYVVHYRNLKFYVKHGLKIDNIRRVLKFRQSPFLRDYVMHCTEMRKRATSDVLKNLYKLQINSLYGKTLEGTRNRKQMSLVSDQKLFVKMISKTSFHGFKIFHDDLVAVEMKRLKVCLNKPIYIGCSVLDLSKLRMFTYHYEYAIPTFGHENIDLLMTDTDSLAYHIKTEDWYKSMAANIELYDTSNYPISHELYSQERHKDIYTFKDETGSIPIDAFCALRSKLYAFRLVSGHEEKRAKGVKRGVLKRDIKFDDYKDCLLNHTVKRANMNYIRSYNHKVFTIEQKRICLTCYDDKRYYLPDGIHSRAHFHYLNNVDSN